MRLKWETWETARSVPSVESPRSLPRVDDPIHDTQMPGHRQNTPAAINVDGPNRRPHVQGRQYERHGGWNHRRAKRGILGRFPGGSSQGVFGLLVRTSLKLFSYEVSPEATAIRTSASLEPGALPNWPQSHPIQVSRR